MSTHVETQQKIHNGSHAVVIGGSMAGLLAARILVEHFEHVTVVERDRLQSYLRSGYDRCCIGCFNP
ncbi:hypothetical protein [Brasilonema sp. UFV-L1]|uniref:hypothetical protein n=1 Tax=Brasilonema sp. UFV-L1 TaxID=2234130 RepID=UPI001B7CE609|nr:hypothetical protein [Brasilonema sp. UFV-L1]